ncbi:hypothetical protein F4860DRAFT_249344 [Xylaria cubensis]|nr:hypothetical protein F4860DRAFT_249344 [Xylaria cubensis]
MQACFLARSLLGFHSITDNPPKAHHLSADPSTIYHTYIYTYTYICSQAIPIRISASYLLTHLYLPHISPIPSSGHFSCSQAKSYSLGRVVVWLCVCCGVHSGLVCARVVWTVGRPWTWTATCEGLALSRRFRPPPSTLMLLLAKPNLSSALSHTIHITYLHTSFTSVSFLSLLLLLSPLSSQLLF